MTVETRDFGVLELDEGEQLDFKAPIFGFEDLTKYVLLSDDEAGAGLTWLQSIEIPDVCFVLLDPEEIGLEYRPELTKDVTEMLALNEAPVVRLITVVPGDFKDATVNLKSPVLINPKNKWAGQIILEQDYPIRMRLFDEEGGQC